MDSFCLRWKAQRLKSVFYLFTALLAACATPVKKPVIQGADHWTAKGKIGIRQESKAQSLNFTWINSGLDFDIHMSGSLGFGSVNIKKRPQGVSLTTNKGTQFADSAESLLLATTGWALPVSALTHWVLGKPSPTSAIDHAEYDPLNNLQFLKQEGWEITYSNYRPYKEELRPSRITASRDALNLKIVVKSWN